MSERVLLEGPVEDGDEEEKGLLRDPNPPDRLCVDEPWFVVERLEERGRKSNELLVAEELLLG